MGGNIISCHGDKKGHNPYEVYGIKLDGKEPLPLRPKVKGNNYTSLPLKPDSLQQLTDNNNSKMNHVQYRKPTSNGVVKQVTISETHSSSCPSSPTSGRRKNDRPPPKPPRMRSYAESQYRSVDSPDSLMDQSIERFIKEHNIPHGSLGRAQRAIKLAKRGDWEESAGGNFVTLTPVKLASRSSLLHLPISEKFTKVYTLSQDVLAQMLDSDAILAQCVDRGLLTPEVELQIMGCQTKQRRCSLLLGAVVDETPNNIGPLTEILRECPSQSHLADLLEVLQIIIQSVSDIKANQDAVETPIGGEDDDFLQDECAIFQIDICYCDRETGESLSIEEAKHLDKSLEETLEDMGKIKRRSYYETCTIRDWNANLQAHCRIVPVVKVDLYNRKLGSEGVEFLSTILENYSCIRELYLAKNAIDIKGVQRLSKALIENHGLAKLDLRLNFFGDDGAPYIAEALRRNKSLRSLNVTCTGLTAVGVNTIAEALAKNNSLMELDVGFNDLEGSGCDMLADIMKNNAYIKRLRMRHANLCSTGYSKIFKSLRINSRLSTLDISSINIGDDGASVLAEILLSNRTLLDINLEKCGITQNGAEAISRSLKANTTLKTMDISMNIVQDEGAIALADSLKYNHTLDCVCLNMCGIGNHGFIALLNALRVNTSIAVLKLCYNVIGHEDQPLEVENHYLVLEELYEKLSHILNNRAELKLLLWGNRLNEAFLSGEARLDDSCRSRLRSSTVL